MTDHPLGDRATLPGLDGLSPAGAKAHLVAFHGGLPLAEDASLAAVHRQSHREGRIAVAHGHVGAGWEMATLPTDESARFDPTQPRDPFGRWVHVGLHVRVKAGTNLGEEGHVAELHPAGPRDTTGRGLVTIETADRRRVKAYAVNLEPTGKAARVPAPARRAETAEQERLSNLPSDMARGEMLAHLARLHHRHPTSGQQANLDGYHARMHRQGDLPVPHSHGESEQVTAARAGRIVTSSGLDITTTAEAVRGLPVPPRLMAQEWR